MVALLLGLVLLLAAPAQAQPAQPQPSDDCMALFKSADMGDPWSDLVERWRSLSPEKADSLRTLPPTYRRVRECLGDNHVDLVLNTYWDETFVRAWLQQFPKAFDTFDSFFDRFEPVPDRYTGAQRDSILFRTSRMYRARGYLNYRLGNLTASISDYTRALDHLGPDRSVERVELTLDLGVIIQRTQDFERARRHFERAISMAESLNREEADAGKFLARALFDLADVMVEEMTAAESYPEDRLRRAADLIQRSMKINAEYEQYWSARARPLQNSLLASVRAHLGDFDGAYRSIETALRAARQSGEGYTKMVVTRNWGVIDLMAGNFDSARSRFRSALDLAREQRHLDNQRRALSRLGLVAELQGRLGEAESRYRDAVRVIEEYRSSLRATQWSVTAFNQWKDAYRGLVRVLMMQDRPAEAFRVLERTRAQHLADLRIQDRLSQDLPSRLRVRYDSLTRELVDLRNEVASAPPERADSLRARETQLVANRRRLLVFPERPEVPSLDSLQATLRREDRALISYFVDAPTPAYDREPHSFAFVLTPDTLQSVRLDGVTQNGIQADIESISPLFRTQGKSSGINAVHFDLRPLYALQQRVFGPVEHLVPEQSRLAIVPDGPLFHLPFSMMVMEDPPSRFAYRDAQYLLNEHPTSVALSASLVGQPVGRSSPSSFRTDLAAFGVSDFDDPRQVPTSIRIAIPGLSPDSSSIRLAPLPGVRREIRSLRTLVEDGKFTLNSRATEAAFHASESQSKILHLASHAFVHPSSPLFNAFALAPGSTASPRDDGWLFLHEIQANNASIPLVVLSGCSTARGALRSGEGMEGLQYAFRAMGAESTVSNLWPADDGAAVELVRSFYRNLQKGQPKDVALQNAQQTYLARHPDNVSPFFWSTTVLYGNPEPVSISPPSFTTWIFRLLPGWTYLLLAYAAIAVLATAARSPLPSSPSRSA